ncbi:MAG: hypothetical protein FWH06_05415 [Oscillospiraceae bacterium]|nr:hypothetical protein [Oscillospiraceae bacterium]
MKTVGVSAAAVILLSLIAGIIILQIYLSKNRNKWLGLILPIISVVVSLSMIFGMAGMMMIRTEIYADGQMVIAEPTAAPGREQGSIIPFIPQVTMVFLLSNIPTALLLLIYFSCRGRFKEQREINKMKIQDLE